VGQTVTGVAGTEAIVTNSGDQTAVVLNFTIPAGAAGEKGDPGDPGQDGSGVTIKGEATEYPPDAAPVEGDMWLVPDPVPAGFPEGTQAGDGLVWNGTSWTNVGPIRGPVGATGPAGPAATVQAGTVTMLAPGEVPTVTNSGTTSAAVFNFAIPAAADGQDGAAGPAGADGQDGANYEVYTQANEPVALRSGALWFVP
jgi:hypothetical protein